MKHIIIGGDGFVGRHLADRLSRLGEEVVVGDIVKSDLPVYRTVPFVTVDVTKPETFRAIDLQPDDVVYNLSARMLSPIMPRACNALNTAAFCLISLSSLRTRLSLPSNSLRSI